MKRHLLLFILFFLPNGFAEESWRILKSSPPFSYTAEFDCKKGDASVGKVVRSGLLCPRYHYDLYDTSHSFQARSITRFLSLGMVYSWGMEMDIYDAAFFPIGSIQGRVVTRARAKFDFCNAQGYPTASAYLNTETAEFIIVAAQDESVVLAEMQGKAFGDVSSWEMKIKDAPFTLDERLLKIFAAFVSDYHSQFLPKPKEIHHYYPDNRRSY